MNPSVTTTTTAAAPGRPSHSQRSTGSRGDGAAPFASALDGALATADGASDSASPAGSGPRRWPTEAAARAHADRPGEPGLHGVRMQTGRSRAERTGTPSTIDDDDRGPQDEATAPASDTVAAALPALWALSQGMTAGQDPSAASATGPESVGGTLIGPAAPAPGTDQPTPVEFTGLAPAGATAPAPTTFLPLDAPSAAGQAAGSPHPPLASGTATGSPPTGAPPVADLPPAPSGAGALPSAGALPLLGGLPSVGVPSADDAPANAPAGGPPAAPGPAVQLAGASAAQPGAAGERLLAPPLPVDPVPATGAPTATVPAGTGAADLLPAPAAELTADLTVMAPSGPAEPPRSDATTAPEAAAGRTHPSAAESTPGPDPVPLTAPPVAPRAVSVPVAAAAPQPPAPPVATQLVQRLTGLRSAPDGSQTMTVVLTPDHLGPVQVEVTLTRGALDLTLRGAHVTSRDALLAALPDLRRDLESAGMSCSRLDVDRDTGGSWSAQQQPADQHAGGSSAGPSDGGRGAARSDSRRPSWAGPLHLGEARPGLALGHSTSSGVDVRV